MRSSTASGIFLAPVILAALSFIPGAAGPAWAESGNKAPLPKVDSAIPAYAPSVRLEKQLTSIGSDSMGDLVELWAEAYGKVQPVSIKLEHQGSASAPAALIEGSADLGPMARQMKPTERSGFIAHYGFQPTQVRTAIAAVAVYVSKQNPLREISFDQLNAIYSAQPKSGLIHPENWQVLNGAGSPVPADGGIYALAADMDPYAFAYFRQQVLAGTDLNAGVTSTGDIGSMLELIKNRPNAIGFGLLATPPSGVKIIGIKRDPADRGVMPAESELQAGNYPLGRFLNVYIVRDPDKGIDDGVKDFLSFILSKQGQTLVSKEGLMPLPHALVTEERSRLGL